MRRGRAVIAHTDVENGYLRRADNGGSILMDAKVRESFSVREHLKDGRLSVHFVPAEGLSPGDMIEVRLGLVDRAMPEPVFAEPTLLRVTAEREESEDEDKPNGQRKPRKPDGGDNDAGSAPTHGMPRFVLLTRDGRSVEGVETEAWPADFNEHDGGEIVDLGEGETLYKINYDNAYHLRYRLTQRGALAREVVTEKYILGMRILLLGYEHAMRSLKHIGGSGIGEFADDFRRMAARGAASTVLALAENLPKIVDTSSIGSDEPE
jgi:hypothetical protein